ncbi:ribbon-helix-helix protein, CopG family (plasmid) [Klebsiella pneumoniae]|uniref:ribbon-helix-helix protein, CopG family n=1 Tax=Klebsiella pneumoniae TaxID=573 RepID=UPI003985FF7C
MIAVSLPDELLQKLDNAVAKTGKKRSYLIRESIQMYLNQIENTHEKRRDHPEHLKTVLSDPN